MTVYERRYLILSTAAVVIVAFGIPDVARAQTICSGQPIAGGTGISCSNAFQIVATGTTTASVGADTNGQGLALTSSGDQVTNLVITGPYQTSTDNGISAVSGGSIRLSVAGTISTTGVGGNGDAVFLMPTGTLNVSLQDIATSGRNAWGLNWWGGTGGSISVQDVSTSGGGWAAGILVDSVKGAINVVARDITATGHGISVSYSEGPLSVVARNILITGDDYEGIRIVHGDGVINLNVNSIEVNGKDGGGVYVSGSSRITASLGSVLTRGLNSPGILIFNGSGDTSVIVGGVSTSGALSHGARIESQGGVTFSNQGSVIVSGADSYGIDVRAGSSPVTVTTGVVTSTAANAAADASFAAVRIVAAGAAPVIVNASGNISTTATNGSGIWAQTGGIITTNVNTGVTVQGQTAVTLGGATGNTLVVNGTIRSTTVGAPSYAVIGGPLSLTLGAAGVIQGPLAFTAGNDSFTNNNTVGYTQSGVIDFRVGNDTFTNTTSFTQNAAVNFGDGNDAVVNNGIYNAVGTTDFGLGTDTFTNNAAGQVRAFDGATTFANLETFTNANGMIDLRDGAANDSFTISGNYVATGAARLGIDVAGATNVNIADRLVIGGTTTGTTTVLATFINPVIDPTGALIVDSTLGNITTGQFVLGGTTSAGLINYSLEARAGDVFLVSRPDEVVFDQLLVGRLANDIWYQSAEAYQSYAMSRRIDYGNARKGSVGIWSQLYGSQERFGDRSRTVSAFNTSLTTSSRFETKRRGAQSGLDFGAQNFVVGVTAGYEHGKGGSDFGTDLDLEGYNYGAYAQFGAEQGIYAGVLMKRDDYEVRVINNAIGATMVRPDGRSTGIDGEAGIRFGSPGSTNFDVGAGLSYVRSRVDGYRFGNVDFSGQRHTSTRGRFQARASFAGALAPFIDGKLFQEFGDANDLSVRSGLLTSSIDDQKRGTWGRVETGIGGGAGGGPLISGWVDLGDVKGYGVRGGFRF